MYACLNEFSFGFFSISKFYANKSCYLTKFWRQYFVFRSRYNSSSSSQDSANSSNSRWSPTSNMWSPKWSSSQSPPSPPAENHYINRSRFVSHGQFQQQLQAPGYRIQEGQVSSMNGHYGHQQNNQGHQQHNQGLPNEIMLNNLMGLLKIQQGELYQ